MSISNCPVDWTPFDNYSENTVTCRCGAVYRSHVKLTFNGNSPILWSRKPCPTCNLFEGNVQKASSDPELMVSGPTQVLPVVATDPLKEAVRLLRAFRTLEGANRTMGKAQAATFMARLVRDIDTFLAAQGKV